MRAQPLVKNYWCPQQIAIILKVSESQNLILVNHYTDGTNIKKGDQRLKDMILSIQQHHPDTPIVLGGDLNRNEEDTKLLARSLNLMRASTEMGAYSRRQKSNPDALLDYFLSS